MKKPILATRSPRATTAPRRTTAPALPPDPDGRNTQRAAAVASALDAFRLHTGADLEDAASDLLADLLHWCDRHGQRFAKELRRARTHYAAETADLTQAAPGRHRD